MWQGLDMRIKAGVTLLAGLGTCVLLLLFGQAAMREEYQDVSIFAYASEPSRYEVHNELLLRAVELIGACTPEEAADIWANGLKERSAAEQYVVMGDALKREYQKQLETSAPMWVTGVSSPWIQSYTTALIQSPTQTRQIRHLLFTTESSAGPGPVVSAVLTLDKQAGYWRITGIAGDQDLEAYTGFRPPSDWPMCE